MERALMERAFVTPVGHQMIALRLSVRLLLWHTSDTTRVSTFLCLVHTIAAVMVVANWERVFVTLTSTALVVNCILTTSVATLAA